MGKYSKLYVALAGAAVNLLTNLLGASNVWTVTAIALLTALGVYQASNAE